MNGYVHSILRRFPTKKRKAKPMLLNLKHWLRFLLEIYIYKNKRKDPCRAMVNYHYKVNSFAMIRADAYVWDEMRFPYVMKRR